MLGRRTLAVTLTAAALACSGSNTELRDVEARAPAPGAGKPTKVLVVGLAQGEVRRAWEADMASRLRELGLETVESAAVLPAASVPAKEELRAAVERTGADAVLAARLAATREQTRVESGPPIAGYAPYPLYRPYGFYDYYSAAAPWVYQPTYLETEKVVELETRLFRTEGDGQLVWRATSETFDPRSVADVIEGVNEKTVARMKADGAL